MFHKSKFLKGIMQFFIKNILLEQTKTKTKQMINNIITLKNKALLVELKKNKN